MCIVFVAAVIYLTLNALRVCLNNRFGGCGRVRSGIFESSNLVNQSIKKLA
jgi:hypothetical protein